MRLWRQCTIERERGTTNERQHQQWRATLWCAVCVLRACVLTCGDSARLNECTGHRQQAGNRQRQREANERKRKILKQRNRQRKKEARDKATRRIEKQMYTSGGVVRQ